MSLIKGGSVASLLAGSRKVRATFTDIGAAPGIFSRDEDGYYGSKVARQPLKVAGQWVSPVE